MSSVDIATIEEAMKMASLDTLRGYAQNHYGQVQQYAKTEYISKGQATGYQVLREPLWNKGKLRVPGTFSFLGPRLHLHCMIRALSSSHGFFRRSLLSWQGSSKPG
jgi:hypothetical protein